MMESDDRHEHNVLVFPTLEAAIAQAQGLLANFVSDISLSSKIDLVFGTQVDSSAAKSLITELAAEDSTALPKIEVRSASEINGANAAFAGASYTIYLSWEFLTENAGNVSAITAVLLEEIGHVIDFRLNASDTLGDEGELFSALVRGVELSDGELQRIKGEDDSAVVAIDGETVQIEQNNDSYEPNDTRQTAKYFGIITANQQWNNLVITKTDLDWFKFQLTKTGSNNTSVEVVSQASGLSTVIELYDSQGNLLEGNYYNSQISLANKPAGVYYVKAIANSGDFSYYYYDQGNYSLKVNIPDPTAPPYGDQFEPNDTRQTAKDFGIITNTQQWDNLVVTKTDQDWFKFELTQPGYVNSSVEVVSQASGLSTVIELYDSQGNLWEGNYYNSQISLANKPAGVYYVKAIANNGDFNYYYYDKGNYSFKINIPDPTAPPYGDQFEPNNTRQTAKDLGVITTTQQWYNLVVTKADQDWLKFQLNKPGTGNNYLEIIADPTGLSVVFDLYDTQGNLLTYNYNPASKISLAGKSAGVYYVKIRAFEGSMNYYYYDLGNYSFKINAPDPNAHSSDNFEPNDTRQTATDLGTITGLRQYNNLSFIPGDSDWFKFQINETATNNNYLEFVPNVSENSWSIYGGNFALYDSQGNWLKSSDISYTYWGNSSKISLEGLSAGTYYAQIASYSLTNDYKLNINAPGKTIVIPTDAFESNNSRENAKNLGDILGVFKQDNLSITSGDEDWFKFQLTDTGIKGNNLRISFNDKLGDLDLYLYDQNGTLIKKSETNSDLEQIDLNGIATGTYYAKILGYQGATNPNYTLSIKAPSKDIYENNNGSETASDLTQLTGLKVIENLSIHNKTDVDWLKISLVHPCQANHYLQIDFDSTLGDLDLELYNLNNLATPILFSKTTGNSEKINLDGYQGGTYLLKIYGYLGATNPNYTLTLNVPETITKDKFEDNNTKNTATDLTPLGKNQTQSLLTLISPTNNLSIDQPGDQDWFKFAIVETARTNHYAEINFDYTIGDLDLALYNATDTKAIRTSSVIGNLERISLANLSPGDYYLQVLGYKNATNSNYSLSIDAPWKVTEYNPDGSESNNTLAQATDLGNLTSLLTKSNLSIHNTTDVDWFKFSVSTKGKLNNSVGITFDNTRGDLDLELYDSEGKLLQGSKTRSSQETISLANLTPGSYYVKVLGYNGATNPNYSLSINPPAGIAGDWAETNDSQTKAYNLRTVSGLKTWDSLSLHIPDREDWFKFNLENPGQAGNSARIDFDHTLGDLDLYLYDQNGTLKGSSETNQNFESVDLKNLTSGTYFLKIVGHNHATNSSYFLSLNAPTGILSDWAEGETGNNSKNTAYDLKELQSSSSFADLSIHTAGDEDWFKFSTFDQGKASSTFSLEFDNSKGDLSLLIIAPNGQQYTSASNSNRERVSLEGLPQGTYYVKVFGATNTTINPNYSLIIDAPKKAEKDWIDKANANNTQVTAYDLRDLKGSVSLEGLSIDSNSEQDWFTFNLTQAPLKGQFVRIDFDNSEGDLALQLIDPDNNTVNVNTSNDFEEISLAGKKQGKYFVKVVGITGVTNPSYTLSIDGTQIPEADSLEPGNETPLQAYDLKDLNTGSRRLYSALVGGNFGYAIGIAESNTNRIYQNMISNGITPIVNINYVRSVTGGSAPYYTSSSSYYSPYYSSYYSPYYSSYYSPYYSSYYYSSSIINNFNNNFNGVKDIYNILGSVGLTGNDYSRWKDDYFSRMGWNDRGNYTIGNNSYRNSSSYRSSSNSSFAAVKSWWEGLYPGSRNAEDGTLSSLSIHSSTDQDWFKFELSSDGQEGQNSIIDFDHNQGNLQLELYEAFNPNTTTQNDYQKYLVDKVNGNGDTEEISLSGLAKGSYYVRVTGVNGSTNPYYNLTLNTPPQLTQTEDFTEPNNSNSSPYDLRTVEGSLAVVGLSIHNTTDQDWFQFTTKGIGKTDHKVRIDFSDSQGDLDLILYNQNNQEIARSQTQGDFEEISLNGLAAGTYKVQVFGYSEATNPDYTLSLFTPQITFAPDDLEPNDNFANATKINLINGFNSLSASIHNNDQDCFKFTTTAKGTDANSISIQFDHSQGDLQLELYQDQVDHFTKIGSSLGINNTESISLKDLNPGTYYAKVYGNNNATNSYQLYLNAPVNSNTRQPQNDWTVMVYMTASDLAKYALADINEMEYASSLFPNTVKFSVLWDQSSSQQTYSTPGNSTWGDTGRAIIRPDNNNPNLLSIQDRFDPALNSIVTPFERIGEKNTGDSQTLIDFVKWTAQNAPAKKYALVMWDHGGGDLGGFNRDNEGDSSNALADRMFTNELSYALNTVKASGIEFNLVAFDACLMSMAEVGYALKDYTDILVASEETEGSNGYDYTSAFSVLQLNPDQVDADTVASNIISSYQTQYQGDQKREDTHSASDLTQLSNLTSKLKTFTNAAISITNSATWEAILNARNTATGFNGGIYRDLGQFLDAIANSTSSAITETFKNAAKDAYLALQELILAKTSDRRNSQGLSIYFPNNTSGIDSNYLTRNQAFLSATGWTEFLNNFGSYTSSDSLASDWAESNNVSARAYNFHTLIGDGHQFAGLSLHDLSDEDWYRFTTNGTATTGDKVAITYDKTKNLSFLLRYTDANGQIKEKTATSTSTGQEISLVGLPQGEYRIQVKANGSIIPEYSLTINAPGTPSDGKDWVRGNNQSYKAEDLGVITAKTQFAGLQVDTLQPDWFEFELPKVNTDQITPVKVTINLIGNQTIKTELFNFENLTTSVAVKTGTGKLELTTPKPQPGQKYQLKISQPNGQNAVAYSLLFDPTFEPNYTPIEAFGNTKLVKDTTNNLYAQIDNNNPIAIKNGGTQITTNIYSGWQTLAAETVNGVNQVLWKYNDGNYLHLWTLDSNWNWQSSTGWWGLNSPEAFTQETNFQQDFNGDNQIGNPYTPIEAFGNTKLVKDTTNKLYAQI
nr:T9SS type A sorting domain-containing protein [Microcystis aeruginosa LG13-11]